MLDPALAGEVLRQLHQVLRPLVGGERDRVDRMVDGEKELVAIEQPGPAEHRVRPLHAVPRQLRRDGPVDTDLKHVARLHPWPHETSGVRGEDLLRQRHRAGVHQGPLNAPRPAAAQLRESEESSSWGVQGGASSTLVEEPQAPDLDVFSGRGGTNWVYTRRM